MQACNEAEIPEILPNMASLGIKCSISGKSATGVSETVSWLVDLGCLFFFFLSVLASPQLQNSSDDTHHSLNFQTQRCKPYIYE